MMEASPMCSREEYWEEKSTKSKLEFLADRLEQMAHYIKTHEVTLNALQYHHHTQGGDPAVKLGGLSNDSLCVPWWFSNPINRKPK
jgi:hypothetical protein